MAADAPPRPSYVPFYLIGGFWLLAILVVGFLYFTYGFRQYQDRDTEPTVATTTESVDEVPFTISSSVIENGGMIPAIYTCDEKQMSPPLTFAGIPAGAQSLALVMEDRDIPKNLKADGTFLHWVVYEIDPTAREVRAGEVFGVQGVNGLGVEGYMGPCPPRQYEPREHRYYFTLYALDTALTSPAPMDKEQLLSAMNGHILAETEFYGRYEKRE